MASAPTGQREEDDFSRHLMGFIAAVFGVVADVLVSCWHRCNWGMKRADVCDNDATAENTPEVQHTQRDVRSHSGCVRSHSNTVEDA